MRLLARSSEMKIVKQTKSAALLLCGTLAFGQSAVSNTVSVPLLDDDVSFRVPVKLFGETKYFLVDTGTSATVLDVRYRDRLGTSVRKWDGHDFYRSPEMLLGDMKLAVEEVFCTDLRMFRMITGEPCDGIIGMDFLIKHVIALDFDRQVFTVAHRVPPDVQANGWRIPMKPSNVRHFRVPTVIVGPTTLDLLLDTSDSSTISLKKADWDLIFPPGQNAPVHKLLLAGINKKVTESVLARLPKIEVGTQQYSNVTCVLSMYDTAPSALGMGFFRQHHVTFDFPSTNLYLAPAKSFRAVEEHDMSGLHLLRDGKQTVVHSVDEGSPAALAGVRDGDIIAKVNGLNAGLLKMKHIRRILKMEPEETITLVLQRRESETEVEFRLKRFL
jgi:hypothetical protein